MYVTYHFKERLRLFLSLFLPILIYQLANYSASFVDTAMTGQYRTLDLAGVSTATSLWMTMVRPPYWMLFVQLT